MKHKKTVAAALALSLSGIMAGTAHADNSTPVKAKPKNSCEVVGVVGDSTSITLLGSSATNSVKGDRLIQRDGGYKSSDDPLGTALSKAGVSDVFYDLAVGRTVSESGSYGVSGLDAMKSLGEEAEKKNSPVECWLVVLGTNDAPYGSAGKRIAKVQEAADGLPTFWVAPKVSAQAQQTNPNYDPKTVDEFNAQLTKAAKDADDLEVIDIEASPEDFADGLHYKSSAQKNRAKAIGQAFEERNGS